jgi:arylsulfatase A-like enzyme
MVIGLAPNRVRGRVVGWALKIDPRHVVLAERLEAAGYDTAGFMCCYGFWGPDVHTGLQRGLQHLEIESNGIQLGKKAHAWLAARDEKPNRKPLFMWMHILEPHNWPSAQGEPHNEEEKKRFYDRSLQLSDAIMVEVMSAFAKRPPDQAPIVIVTADHGEGLGDHGQPYHSTDLYDSQTHVPLVMAGPGIHPGRIGETVSLTDLVPTIVELAGFDPPKDGSIDGYSLADLATGKRASNPDGGIAFAAMIQDRSNPGGIVAFTRGPWKLIDADGHEELYNVHADPDEKSNLIGQRLQQPIVEELRKLLKARVDLGKSSPFH